MVRRSKSARFFRMALIASLLAFAAVLFNAYSRLSEAGLGCPDWPGCYGRLIMPVTAQDPVLAAQLETERRPEKRAWKEMVSRYLAAALGLVLIRLAWLGWELKRRKRTQQILIPGLTLALVMTLSVLGVFTFSHQFKPLVMMMQILGGILVLALLWWIVLREQRLFHSATVTPFTRALRVRLWAAMGIVAFQIVLGGWSMVNYAGLACPDFPKCQGAWWPEMDWVSAFTLWRDLGLDYESRLLDLPGTTAIHMAHRVGALVTLLYVGWLALHVLRVGNEGNLCRYGGLVLTVLLLQTVLGVGQISARLPLVAAVAHNAMAVVLLLSLITLYHVVRPPRARQPE